MLLRNISSLSSPWRSTARFALLTASMLLLFQELSAAFEFVCPINGPEDSSTELQAKDENGPDFSAISGLAFSSIQTGPSGQPVMYANIDRRNGKRLGVFDSGSGERLLTLRIPSLPSVFAWESLAIGSCGIHGEAASCIYIGDIGDGYANLSGGAVSGRQGNPYRIYKIREPVLHKFHDNDAIPSKDAYVLEYDYHHPSSPTTFADCQAMFLDHQGWGEGESKGDLYLVPRWGNAHKEYNTRLFQIPASAWDLSEIPYSPASVGDCPNGGHLYGKTFTMANMTLDGTLIAFGGAARCTVIFPRCPGVSVAEALTGDAKGCVRWQHIPGRTRTFAWSSGGTRNLIISEREECDPRGPPLAWTTMDYHSPEATIIRCSDKEANARPVKITGRCPTVVPTEAPLQYYSPEANARPVRTIEGTEGCSTGIPPSFFSPPFSSVFAHLKCQYLACLEEYKTKFDYAPEGFAEVILSRSEEYAEAIKNATDRGNVIASAEMIASLQLFQLYHAVALNEGQLNAQTFATCAGRFGAKCTLDFLQKLIIVVAKEDELTNDVNLAEADKYLERAKVSLREKNWWLATSTAFWGIDLILERLDDDLVGAP